MNPENYCIMFQYFQRPYSMPTARLSLVEAEGTEYSIVFKDGFISDLCISEAFKGLSLPDVSHIAHAQPHKQPCTCKTFFRNTNLINKLLLVQWNPANYELPSSHNWKSFTVCVCASSQHTLGNNRVFNIHRVKHASSDSARETSDALTCSWPRMMTPSGLMGCQGARFSPVPTLCPSW